MTKYNITKKPPVKSISGTLEERSYNLCKIRGNGNSGVGMRLFVEEGIAAFGENQQRNEEMTEKLMDRLILMADAILAMRSEQKMIMQAFEEVLKATSSKEKQD